MEKALPKENLMGTMPEGRLLLRMSIPMILSVLISSLYTLVDSIFVGQLGDKALTAVSLATPVATIMLSIGFGISIGVNALISTKLGEKDTAGANRTAGNGLLMVLVCFVVFALLGVTAVRPFFSFQTSDAEILEMAVSYTAISMIFSIGLMLQTLTERLLSSTGKTAGAMIILGSGAIINIILDPILIFGWFGIPAMGIAGAAYATVFAQICAGAIGLILNP